MPILRHDPSFSCEKRGNLLLTMPNTEFGRFLRETRKRRGMMQKELALLLGITEQALNHMESGRRGPPITARFILLAAALNVPISVLAEKAGLPLPEIDPHAETVGGFAKKLCDRAEPILARFEGLSKSTDRDVKRLRDEISKLRHVIEQLHGLPVTL